YTICLHDALPLSGLVGLHRRGPAALEQAAGQVEGLFLHLDAAPGHLQPAARVAGVGIGAHRFRHDRDARDVVGSLDRFDVGPARLDGAAQAAEQVDLVADIEPGIVHLAVGELAVEPLRRAGLLPVADTAGERRVDRAP